MSRDESAPRQSVTVEIAGEKLLIRTDAPEAYTRRVAAHVEGALRDVTPSLPLEPHRAAILAAMVITDELFRLRDELEEIRGRLDGRAAALAEELERALAGDLAGEE